MLHHVWLHCEAVRELLDPETESHAFRRVRGYLKDGVCCICYSSDDPYPKAKHDVAAGDLPYCIGFDPEAACKKTSVITTR